LRRWNTGHLEKRHGERLAALRADLNEQRYHIALESMRRILGDPTLPPCTRLEVTLKEVEALLALGRPCEAATRLVAALRTMQHYRLYDRRETVEELVRRVEMARKPELG